MKKVLITGGNGDIAKAIICKLNAIGGYDIKAPGRMELNVTDIEMVKRYINSFTPDILINNAGYVAVQSIGVGNIEEDKKALDINLFGTFNCTNAVLKRNSKAQVINIGSSAATKTHATWSSYCAAKAAVVMATKCWAEDNYNVVCISPGRTATKMRKGLYPNEDVETLLKTDDFATIILYAINGKYPSGTHLNVNKQNVEELING